MHGLGKDFLQTRGYPRREEVGCHLAWCTGIGSVVAEVFDCDGHDDVAIAHCSGAIQKNLIRALKEYAP